MTIDHKFNVIGYRSLIVSGGSPPGEIRAQIRVWGKNGESANFVFSDALNSVFSGRMHSNGSFDLDFAFDHYLAVLDMLRNEDSVFVVYDGKNGHIFAGE